MKTLSYKKAHILFLKKEEYIVINDKVHKEKDTPRMNC